MRPLLKSNKPLKFKYLTPFRLRLVDMEQLPKVSGLAVIVGLLMGLLILGFSNLIDWISETALGARAGGFESVPTLILIFAPLAGGGLVIALISALLKVDGRDVGVVHVMDCVQAKGKEITFPMRNAVLQFFGGATALASGLSGGSDGPAIHIGAAGSSFLTKRFNLTDDSIRTLLAAGMAAGIAAIFDTPIAAVILTMEVVLLEVALASLVPVLLAAITANTLVALLADEHALLVSIDFAKVPTTELGLIIVAGIIIGLVATAFNYSIHPFSTVRLNFRYRIGLVAIATSICALWMPELLGIGFDGHV